VPATKKTVPATKAVADKPAKKVELSDKAQELYAQALVNKNGLSLVPAGKVKGNHLVAAELDGGEMIVVNKMVVVREK